MTLLDQLIREQGDEMSARIAVKLGISRSEAEKLLPLVATAVMDRFHHDTQAPGDGEKRTAVSVESLDGILDGATEQVGRNASSHFGLHPDQAVTLVPLVLPTILRFLVRRVPYGGTALVLLSKVVEQQGYGSLDEIAVRLLGRIQVSESGKPRPSLATRLGRLAGKYFPSDSE